MATVPAAIPDTTPVVGIVAIAVLPLVQVPPGVRLASTVELPIQTAVVPRMGVGRGSTVIAAVAIQPVDSV